MKIIKNGKYITKSYKCSRCNCVFEIESAKDIQFEKYQNYIVLIPSSVTIKLYVKCPECKNRMLIDEVEQ